VRLGEQPAGALTDSVDRAAETLTANSSERNSLMSRREIRLRAVNATTAACKAGSNVDSPTVPSLARVRLAHPGHR
jgi:hypothetical protein